MVTVKVCNLGFRCECVGNDLQPFIIGPPGVPLWPRAYRNLVTFQKSSLWGVSCGPLRAPATSFDTPKQSILACGAPGAAEQGWRSARGLGGYSRGERVRPLLTKRLSLGDDTLGGRSAVVPVAMLKVLVLQT